MYAIVKNIPNMITADSTEVGMKASAGLSTAQARIMMSPVITPQNGVFTPDMPLTADLPKEAVTDIEPVKEPKV